MDRHIHTHTHLSLSLYIYIYIYIHTYKYVISVICIIVVEKSKLIDLVSFHPKTVYIHNNKSMNPFFPALFYHYIS